MKFKTHLSFSIFCLVSFIAFTDYSVDIFVISIFFFCSILPDIDTSKSFLGRFVKPIGWFSRHRGFFHSIFPAIGISVLAYFYSKEVAIAAFLGYMSHLFLDALNHQGIAFFYPIMKFRIRGIFKSGSLADYFIMIGSLVVSVLMIIKFRIFFF